MKKDDYPVLEYKILKYLYDTIKYGHVEDLKREELRENLPEISDNYYHYILYSLSQLRFIEDLRVDKHGNEYRLNIFTGCSITPNGIHYLFESPLMKEAQEYIDGNKQWD